MLQIGRKQQTKVQTAVARKKPPAWSKENKRNVVGVDDLTLLSKLSNDAINENLQNRFHGKLIYTYIGNVLISVNPFCDLGIYTEELLQSYVGRTLMDAPPHIFAIAESAVSRMKSYKENQCVIISGESGAGKTEAAKKIMQYIASVCTSESAARNPDNAQESEIVHVRNMILATNPLLESLGNAKTIRNNNSSRFGKYIELYFNSRFEPIGAKISNYLLEKSRVVGQTQNERNFHIFYQLCKAGASMFPDLGVSSPEHFYYTSQAGCFDVAGINDEKEFKEVLAAFDCIGIKAEEQNAIFSLLAAILWLGNITFASDDSDNAVVADETAMLNAANLLGIDPEVMRKSLTQRQIVTPSAGGNVEKIASPLSPGLAAIVRDAYSKVFYDRLFDWIVFRVNQAMTPREQVAQSIGILDIYGFEIFKVNSFEQLCINFVNEKLQQIFIELTLKAEQEDYVAEGITWTPIAYFDNKVVCDLIEGKRPPGIMAIMNDVGARAHADSDRADALLASDLGSLSHQRFVSRSGGFIVRHYAGDVEYTTAAMSEKNRDQTNKDVLEAIKSGRHPMLATLFPEEIDWSNRQRPATSADKIRTSAASLVTALMSCHPNYIRCIKPNENKSPKEFDKERCLHQIKYLGLLQNVMVRRAGFASREPMEAFLNRYYMLSPRTVSAGECSFRGAPKDGCQIILSDMMLKEGEWQLGKTKVFVKNPETVFLFEEMRERYWDTMAIRIQRRFRRHMAAIDRRAALIQDLWRERCGSNALVQMRDRGHQMLGQRKQRRALSISAGRRFFGDYLNVSGVHAGALELRKIAEISSSELIVFSCKALTPVFKLLRATKLSPRTVILTNKNIYVTSTKLDKKTKEIEEFLESKIAIENITAVEFSPLMDNFIHVVSKRDADLVLSMPFKTEFGTFIMYLSNCPCNVKSEWVVTGEDGKKSKTITFVGGSEATPDVKIKGSKITVAAGLPASSDIRKPEPRNYALGGAQRQGPPPKQSQASAAPAANRSVRQSILPPLPSVPSRAPAAPPKPKPSFVPTHTVLYDIEGAEQSELSCKAGAKLLVKSSGDNGWCLAVDESGKEGWVPETYVEII